MRLLGAVTLLLGKAVQRPWATHLQVLPRQSPSHQCGHAHCHHVLDHRKGSVGPTEAGERWGQRSFTVEGCRILQEAAPHQQWWGGWEVRPGPQSWGLPACDWTQGEAAISKLVPRRGTTHLPY